jgi:hypothetical protein
MPKKEKPIEQRLDIEKINKTTAQYFEQLAGNIRKSIERTGLTGENPKDEAIRLVRTIMGFGILSSIKTEPKVIAEALRDVPKRVLITAENRLMAKKQTGILDIVLRAIRLRLGRD